MRPLQFFRSYVSLLVAVACTTSVLTGAENREVHIAPRAAWIEPVAVAREAKTPGTSVGQHYLLVDTQTNVAERSTFRHNAYRILNEDGLRYGSQVSVSFDPSYESLTFHHVRLIRNGEMLDRLDRSKLQVLQRESELDYLLYNGSLSALLILDDVRVGDIVEFAYTKTGSNPVFGDHTIDAFTCDWGTPVAHLRHRVLHPADRAIKHRRSGRSTIELRERDTPAGRELVWEARDLPAVVFDRSIPAWHETTSTVQLTDFATWSDVVAWALPLYAEPEPAVAALREKAAGLRRAGRTPEEQALRALEFVQDEIRYLGIEQGAGTHRPSPPQDVLARRFGDCKDKAWLLVSLLRELGFTAAPVLVHSSRRHTLADWLPSPFAFNHVVVLLQLGGADYILDPTLTHQAGTLAQRHTARYHMGLVIAAGTQALTTWPQSANDVAHTRVEENFKVTGLESNATLHVRSTYSGRAASRMRSQLAGTTREDLAKSYLDFYARYFPDVFSPEPLTWTDDKATNTVVVNEHYTIKNLFVRDTDEKTFRAQFHSTALNDYTSSPGAGGRNAPLAVAHPVDVTNRIHVSLHQPWSIKAEKLMIDDAAFTYERSAESKGNEVEWNYRWRSKADHVSREDFAVHSRNIARVKDTLGYELTYNTAAAGDRFALNWAMIALAGLTAAGSAFGARHLWRTSDSEVPPPLSPTPHSDAALTGLGGWLVLVGIAVVIRPIRIVAELWPSFPTYVNLDTWQVMTTSTSAAFQPSYAIIAPTEMVLNLVLMISSILLVALFFKRRKIFPRVMIAYLAFELATVIFECWATQELGAKAESAQAYSNLLRGFLSCAVWIPYFCVSRRVKLTFTR